MNKQILYQLGNTLYINVTNACDNHCVFCIRDTETGVGGDYNLWLQEDPSAEEIITELNSALKQNYDEVVFCGYGEPLIRLEVVLAVLEFLKEQYPDVPVRINTNGHASAIHKINVPPLLKGVHLSISLNAPTAEKYDAISQPDISNAFEEVLRFAKESIPYAASVTLSVVDVIPAEDIAECRKLAEELGVLFRVREFSA